MYQILARKWRPRNFDAVVGQQHAVQALSNSLKSDRLHHAYLFAGTRGVGKTTLARIFARCLNCEKGVTAEPCGECGACTQINEGRYPDLIEVDAASRTGVDDMRELLENVQYKPIQGRRKIYLIDEVHMLSLSSFNALLKTLEEPPEYIMFLFATTHPKKIPITVLSRCLQLNLTRLPHSSIADYMKQLLEAEKIPYEESAVKEVAFAADGSMRDGLSILDQAVAHGSGELKTELVRQMLGIFGRDRIDELINSIVDRDAARLLEITEELYAHSADFIGLTNDIVSFLHAVSIAQISNASDLDARFNADSVRAIAEKMSAEEVQLFYQIAVNGIRDLPVLPNVRNAFEMMCLRMLAFQPLMAGGTVPVPSKVAAKTSAKTSTGVSTGAPTETTAGATNMDKADTAPPVEDANTRIQTDEATNEVTQAGANANGQKNDMANDAANDAMANGDETLMDTQVSEKNLSAYENAPLWKSFVSQLNPGMVAELCSHSVLQFESEEAATLLLDKEFGYLKEAVEDAALHAAFEEYFVRPIKIKIEVSTDHAETPRQEARRLTDESLKEADEATKNDPLVQELQSQMGARIVSATPVNNTSADESGGTGENNDSKS